MLLNKSESCLLLIDVQEKLTPHVRHADQLLDRCEWLLRLARTLEVPTLISEQYPTGLGTTVATLKHSAASSAEIEKTAFSSFSDPHFRQALHEINKKQLILIGIETHVCVLQTAIELLTEGYDVFVVVDAVSTRFEVDHTYALKRMQQLGVQLLTTEMVFFEWIRDSAAPEFKHLSNTFLKTGR